MNDVDVDVDVDVEDTIDSGTGRIIRSSPMLRDRAI
jgi:hypothetical protein